MWGKPPFYFADNDAIEVRNLAAARKWYMEKLGLREVRTDREEDSGQPFADLYVSDADIFLSLVELGPDTSEQKRHVIFFATDLEKAHQWLVGRGITVEPITTDSGGNRLFRFLDLDGNRIEVCVEPG